MKNKIWKAKESCEPLFKKGDKFIIIERNTNPYLMPISAIHLKDDEIYGFDADELEEI